MLSTLRLYDPRGPRQLVLNQADMAKLNGLAILLLMMLVVVVVVALTTGWVALFVFAFILLRVNGSMRERVGKWLDARA